MRLKGRSVLVTGGAGFLGSHLCAGLLFEGAKVRVLDICTGGPGAGLSYCTKEIDSVNCSMADEVAVLRAADGVDAIVHLAYPMALRQRSLDTAVVAEALAGLLNLIKAAIKNSALLVYISSIGVYGNGRCMPIDESHPVEPVLMHGAVKLAGESFCGSMAKSDGLRSVILRVADIYGPRNARVSVPIKFLLQAMGQEPITIYGDGSDSRTYTFVADFTEAVILSMLHSGAESKIFNIAGDDCISMYELALEVKKVTGSSSPLLFQDCRASGRKLLIDNRKSKELLGFRPSYDISKGLGLTHRWLMENQGYYRQSGL